MLDAGHRLRTSSRRAASAIVLAASAIVLVACSTDSAASASPPIADAGNDAGDASTTDASDAGMCPASAARAAGDTMETIDSGGMTRTYWVHVPPGYTGAAPVPLVFDFHPLTVTALAWSLANAWADVADKQGFIVVRPQGHGNSWHVGRCCDPALSDGVDDVAFVRELLGALENELCVDPKRVYATGCSNGGGMAYDLACNAADVIAAVAPVDFDCMTGATNSPSCDCHPSRPISERQFRATGDMYAPYDGGPTSVVAGLLFPGAQANFADWATIDGCTDAAAPLADNAACQTHTACSGGAEVTLCTIQGGQHCLNYGSFGIEEVAWSMFERTSLPLRSRRRRARCSWISPACSATSTYTKSEREC